LSAASGLSEHFHIIWLSDVQETNAGNLSSKILEAVTAVTSPLSVNLPKSGGANCRKSAPNGGETQLKASASTALTALALGFRREARTSRFVFGGSCSSLLNAASNFSASTVMSSPARPLSEQGTSWVS
jgi:hypothetical protein